jgi:two-component sensor histidine kinase
VARAELEPYEGQGRRRLTLEGDDVALPPRAAVALGMVLHELATNAAKYGSLSSGTGRLTLRWRIDRGEAPAGVLRLEWLESGGPTVARPAQQGFGSRLVKRLIEGELDGRLVVDFRPEGVRVEIAVPLGEARAEPDLERAA